MSRKTAASRFQVLRFFFSLPFSASSFCLSTGTIRLTNTVNVSPGSKLLSVFNGSTPALDLGRLRIESITARFVESWTALSLDSFADLQETRQRKAKKITVGSFILLFLRRL